MKKILQIIKKISILLKKNKLKQKPQKDPYEEQINQMIYEGSPVRDE